MKLSNRFTAALSAAGTVCLLMLWTGLVCAASLEAFVSIPPQKYLLDRLGGAHVKSHVLVGKGQSPHLYQPTSKQIMALSRSRLFFAMDMEFERILNGKLKHSAASLKVINTVFSIEKIPLQEHGHGSRNHTVARDPHVWLSPANLKIMAVNMVDALSTADPSHVQVYNRNLETLVVELEHLDSTIRKELAPFAGASFYVFHPSFGYFARSYNLQQEAVEVEGKSPSPKQLSRLIAKAKKEQVKVIFVQSQFDPRSAKVVAQAIGGKVVPLNPLAENVVGNLRIISGNIHSALSH